MKLLSETIEPLESELQSCDPWACHIAQNPQASKLAQEITAQSLAIYHTSRGYDEYLITCFLFLLEAHDSC